MLHRLEALTGTSPRLEDGVEGWLDPAIATPDRRRHSYTGFTGGRHQFPRLPLAHQGTAARCQGCPADCGLADATGNSGILGRARVGLGHRAPQGFNACHAGSCADGVRRRPAENLLVPHELNGAFGSNRGERLSLSARNNVGAI